MILAQVFEGFVEASPVSLMVRGILEAVLSPQKLDELFNGTYTNSQIACIKLT